jgi:hypothetical protein
MPDKESNLIASVVSPVGTGVPKVEQRIMILGILVPLNPPL